MGDGGETAHCRTDVSSRGISGAGGAGAWGEREPGVSVAQAVPPRVVGAGEHRDGEFASGSCDRSVETGSSAVERPRRAQGRRAETADSVRNDPGGTP